jgi:cold shock CspA family protein
MADGNIKWFGKKRGFGFIKGDELSDIFVFYVPNSPGIKKYFESGDRVSFDIIERKNEPLAINVKKLT